MGIDMCISGHQHDLYIFEPGFITPNTKLKYHSSYYENKKYNGYLTDFKFPCILVSKRGRTQTDDSALTNMKEQIGAYISVDFAKNEQVITYNTSNGDLVDVVNPFVGVDNPENEKSYGNKIVFPLY
jgi:hypothetical protein